jgi:hypothetical protein
MILCEALRDSIGNGVGSVINGVIVIGIVVVGVVVIGVVVIGVEGRRVSATISLVGEEVLTVGVVVESVTVIVGDEESVFVVVEEEESGIVSSVLIFESKVGKIASL